MDDTDDATVTLPQVVSMELMKEGVWIDDGDGVAEIGEIIDYTLTVTNTGNVTLHEIQVDDEGADVTGTLIDSLAPGASNNTNWHATYAITDVDVGEGSYDNTAVANSNEANDTASSHVVLPSGSSGESAMSGFGSGNEKWDYLFV